MKILAFDMATHKTGWAFFNNDNLVNYGIIQADKKQKDFRKRIVQIFETIESLIKMNNPDVIVVEEVPIYNEAGSYLLVMQGYMVCVANNTKKPISFYRPTEWRKNLGLIGNNGREALKKNQIKGKTVAWVNKRFGLNLKFYEKDTKDHISDDDIADAIGLAMAHYYGECNGD